MSNRSSFFRLPKHKKFDYIPRHYNPDEESRKERLGEKKIKMEKGAFFTQQKNSRISGAFSARGDSYFNSARTSKAHQFKRTMLLFVMLGVGALYMIGHVNGVLTLLLLLALLIVFITQVNKY